MLKVKIFQKREKMINKTRFVPNCFICLICLALGACDPIGDCNDAGGRWVEELGECECTYEDRGNYSPHISDEEYEKCRLIEEVDGPLPN